MENKKDIKIYLGISAGNWNQRLYSDKHHFSNLSLRKQTALSKWFCCLKDIGLHNQFDGILLKDQPPQIISEVDVISI